MKEVNFTKDMLQALTKARTWLEIEKPNIDEALDLEYASIKSISTDTMSKTRTGKRLPSREAIYADKLNMLEVHVLMANAVQTYYQAVLEHVRPEYRAVFELYFNTNRSVDEISKMTSYSSIRIYQIINEETERICCMKDRL